MSQPLIRGYEMRLAFPECHPGTDRCRAFVSLEDDIGEALAYLNAELGGYDYHHHDKILIWANDGRIYAFRPHEIAIAPVYDNVEARKLADALIETVNDIWRRRDEIEPNFEGRKKPPNALDIYRLLPGKNCKECGSPTCFAFAAVLRNDSAKSPLCPYLAMNAYTRLLSSPQPFRQRVSDSSR